MCDAKRHFVGNKQSVQHTPSTSHGPDRHVKVGYVAPRARRSVFRAVCTYKPTVAAHERAEYLVAQAADTTARGYYSRRAALTRCDTPRANSTQQASPVWSARGRVAAKERPTRLKPWPLERPTTGHVSHGGLVLEKANLSTRLPVR